MEYFSIFISHCFQGITFYAMYLQVDNTGGEQVDNTGGEYVDNTREEQVDNTRGEQADRTGEEQVGKENKVGW